MILSVKGTFLTRYFTLVNFILNLSLGVLCFWFLEGDIIFNIYMLFAGWEVSMVKNCDRGLENAFFKHF